MIIVVGGGISGLVAARSLAARGSVLLLEASTRLGGKIDSVELEGLRLDTGAEAVLARRPEAVALMTELGLAPVSPTPARAGLLIGGRRIAMPVSRQGIPVDVEALAELLTPDGLARARQEPELPAPALAGDVGVGAYVAQRFGPEVTDRLLEPLLGGVYAGRSRDLSFAAVNRPLFEQARHGGSLLHAARSSAAPVSAGPVFAGLAGGVSGLVDALVDDLAGRGVELRTQATVRGLRRSGRAFELVVGSTHAEQRLVAEAVVLAVPATAAGRLLAGLVPSAAEFGAIPYASTALVTLVVRGLLPEGSGLLAPPGELATIKAATHSSTKWAWLRAAATGVWDADTHVLRLSVGRLGEEALLQLGDEALLARTFAEARAGLPGWAQAELVTGRVTRWGGGLPQYRVGHPDLVARLRSDLAAVPGLAVAGAALDGVGVAPCIASAAAAVTKINRDLGGAAGMMER